MTMNNVDARYKEYCKTHGDHDKIMKQKARQQELRSKSTVCPNCNKEMKVGSLSKHIKNSCKGKPVEKPNEES